MHPDVAEEALSLNYEMEDVKSSPCLKYEEEWLALSKVDIEMTGLKEKIMEGELRASRFRSVIWRLLLGALTPGYPDHWPEETRTSREHYKKLKESIAVKPCLMSEPERDNPLSTNEKSSWHQYFCDKELKCLIKQDVVRTFPGVDFFRSEEIQEAMINILFCYARENPTMCYRQGMHEVLAPVVFVVKSDHHALLHTKEQITLRSDILYVVNPDYFEEDSYTLFRRIMNAIEGSYLIPNVAPTSTGYFPCHTNAGANANENQVIAQLNWIKEILLAPSDPELHDHLVKLDIPLPLFGIRWLRLLFGREFPLQDLLVLWDAIFAENRSFDLVNYIVVAMLSSVRKTLLEADYTNCLTTLMRYPGVTDISMIIDYALHLKNPSVCKIPSKFKVIPKVSNKAKEKKNKIMNGPASTNNRKYVPNLVYRPAQLQSPSYDQDRNFSDGYLLNEPDLLLRELKHAQNIISLCSVKLAQYHRVLEKSVDPDDVQAHSALTGMQELSNLLADNVRKSEPVAVEPAFEAQEKIISPTTKKPPTSPTDKEQVKPTQPLSRPRSVDMTVFKSTSMPIKEDDLEAAEFTLSLLKLS
uniref:TBC1 domain family member 5 n=1 Tax=Lygus hesperus TaxID=30085 RepID=A0A0A9ZED7_LYGHE